MGRIIVPDMTEMPRTADVVIVGGGIIGVASAFYLGQTGLDVVVLEQADALATLTTSASAECFRAQFSEPENVAMMQASIAVFEHFAEVVGIPGYDIGIHQQGYLFITDTEEGAAELKARVAHQQSMGLADVEYLPGDEVRRRFPYLAPGVTGAAFRARDGWLAAHEVTYGLAKGAAARFLLQTPATGFVLDSQGLAGVETSRGTIATRAVVVATGPFAARVAGWAGVKLPLVNQRRHKAIVRDPEIPSWAPMTIDTVTGAHWRPEAGGGMLLWATAFDEPPDEPRLQVPIEWSFPALVMEALTRTCPFWGKVADRLRREDVTITAGQYTSAPDEKPIIGQAPGVPGLWLNVGYSGHGVMGSIGGAQLLARLMSGQDEEANNPFRASRFAEPGFIVVEKMTI